MCFSLFDFKSLSLQDDATEHPLQKEFDFLFFPKIDVYNFHRAKIIVHITITNTIISCVISLNSFAKPQSYNAKILILL